MAIRSISAVNEDCCTGCGACYNKCPVNAIEMKYNSEGFLFPVIDSEKCIACGLCGMVCPELNMETVIQKMHPEGKCYAAMAEDEIRMISSSGGIFSLLAENVYAKNGVVCGAVYNDDYTEVYHIASNDVQDLSRLRGSKYVQSNMGTVYSQAEEALKDHRPVLFVGCPCQISGLYAYLRNESTELLYTVDLVCHGANSTYAYRSYIAEVADGRTIEKVNFRDKSVFGWSTPVTIHFGDGSVYNAAWNQNKWSEAFLGGIINRKSCGACHYARRERVADITLGDFWQVHKWDETCNDWKGTSLVLLNSKRGKRLYSEIVCRLKLNKEAPLDFAVQYNGQLVRPPEAALGRKIFFKHLLKDGYHKALWYGHRWRYDVGLVGWWFSANYGSVLTYYALGKCLEDMELLPIMVRIPRKDGKGWEPVTEKNIAFIEKHFLITKPRKFEEMYECNQFCDAFMLGSDQLWVSNYNEMLGYTFYLDFADARKKKIAYATSLGYAKYNGSEEDKKIVSILLKRFDGISVRENSGVELCKNEFNVDARRMLDPVFLCDISHYNLLADDSRIIEKEKYLLCYILDPTEEKRRAVRELESHYHIKSCVILDMKNYEKCYQTWHDENIITNVGIEEFVYLIKNCDFLLTDSLHGASFGIIYHKNIAVVANPRRGRARFDSLFRLLDIESVLWEEGQLDKLVKNIVPVDYVSIDRILEKERNISWKWLQEILFSEKNREETMEDIFAKYFNELQRERIKNTVKN